MSDFVFNKEYELSELVSFVGEKIESEKVTLDTYISTDNMLVDRGGVEPATKLPSASKFNNFKVGDTLFSNIRTYFRKVWLADFEGGASPDVLIFRTNDSEKLDPNYLYFLLSNEDFVNYTVLTAKGAKMPRGDKAAIMQYKFFLPDIDKQREIGLGLLAMNKKIELNRQTNQTLEQIAQAIFQSWFVDFEPTRAKIAAKQIGRARQDGERSAALREALLSEGRWPETIAGAIAEGDPERAAMAAISGKSLEELDQLSPEQQEQLKTTAALFPNALVDSELGEIPEGWELSKLGEIIDFNPKRTLKKGELAPYLDMKNVPTQGHLAEDVYLREMASGTKFKNGDTLLARITPCLENGKTAYVDFLDDNQVGWGSTEYIVMRPKNGRPLSLGYLIARLESFRNQAIQTMTGTSGRQRASANALSELSWIDYPLELLENFDKFADRFLKSAKKNGEEVKVLSKLRDSLLPKLLSGEISLVDENVQLEITA